MEEVIGEERIINDFVFFISGESGGRTLEKLHKEDNRQG